MAHSIRSDGWQGEFDDWFREFMARNAIPGAAASVFTQDEILLEAGYGYRDVEAGKPVTPDTLFGIASVTKSFTALTVLHAVSAGHLRLDDPVTRWLPELTVWNGRRAPTIEHFLTHTSGLPALPTLVDAMAPSTASDPLDTPPERVRPAGTSTEIMTLINADAELLGEPGSVFCYQNDAYGLVGEIVTRATGVRFGKYLADNLTAPLGMHRTTFDLDRVLADDDATTLYAADPAGNVMASPRWQESAPLAAAGFLRSTARDLTRYVRFLLARDGTALGIDDPLLDRMQSQLVWAGTPHTYGLGLALQDWHSGTIIMHSGGLKGVSSYIGFVPELGIGAVILTNLENQAADKAWLAAVNVLLGLDPETPRYEPDEAAVSSADAEALLGEYRSGEPWGVFRLTRDPEGAWFADEGEGVTFPVSLVNRNLIRVHKAEQDRLVDVLRRGDDTVWGVHMGKRVLLRQG